MSEVTLRDFDIDLESIDISLINMLNKYKNRLPNFKNKTDEEIIDIPFSLFRKQKHSRFHKENNFNFDIQVLSLAPYKSSGINLCLRAGDCKNYCLGIGLLRSMDSEEYHLSDPYALFYKTLKTIAFSNKEKFMEHLAISIAKLCERKRHRFKNIVFRLNGYSDIKWEDIRFTLDSNVLNTLRSRLQNSLFPLYDNKVYDKFSHLNQNIISNELQGNYNIFELFSGLQFYDYTKYLPTERNINISNYHLVFSYDKHLSNNISKVDKKLDIVVIIDISIKNNILKKKRMCKKFNIIDGDLYDFRYFDKFKFKKYNEKLGFIILLELLDGNKFKENEAFNSSYVYSNNGDNSIIIKDLRDRI
ncbi:hypothetical protein [Halarcobacter sp.]|uniref:GP88 family protein n=1 Tax=Halarcobacter sp. TaxID=2321133 RepID=UPI003A95ACB7